jgi:hypothetical protein
LSGARADAAEDLAEIANQSCSRLSRASHFAS